VRALVVAGWARAGLEPPADLLAMGGGRAGTVGGPDPIAHRPPVALASAALAAAHRLGSDYERQLDARSRAAGAHYTPPDVAHGVTRLVIADAPARTSEPTVWDPACGGGAFLLAAAGVLASLGHEPSRIVNDLLWGTDTDPGAVAVAEAALVLWATLSGAPDARPGPHLEVADSLRSGPPLARADFAFVVGNPPFQGQMTGGSVRTRRAREALRERWGDVVGPYTDTSTLFLVAGTSVLAAGGRMGMILPTSVLSARDAQRAREHIDRSADLVGLWVATEPVFAASVAVCAPVLARRSRVVAGSMVTPEPAIAGGPPVERWRRRGFEQLASIHREGRRWSELALAAIDVPSPRFASSGTVGSVAEASSGFRDEYYGLVDSVIDLAEEERPSPSGSAPSEVRPLITSGTIDPGRCLWGERPARFAKRSFLMPVVDVAALARAAAGGGAAARAAAWAEATRGPKVVVATQTKVGEAAVDEEGGWVPSTPTIVLRPVAGGHLPGSDAVEMSWALAAVVCSPIGSVAALAASFGSGRTSHALKPTAASVLDLPLPVDPDAWAAGARALRERDRDGFAAAMAEAYGLDAGDAADLQGWWTSRAPW